MAGQTTLSVIFVILSMVFSALPLSTDAKLQLIVLDGKVYKPRCEEEHALYCEDVRDYPEEQIRQLLENKSLILEQCFGDDHIPSRTRRMVESEDDEISLCQSQVKVIYPKVGLDVHGNYEYVLNTGSVTQGLRVEECVNPGSPCTFADIFPNGYRPICKQNYVYRNVLTYNSEGKVESNRIQVPSACECVLKISTK